MKRYTLIYLLIILLLFCNEAIADGFRNLTADGWNKTDRVNVMDYGAIPDDSNDDSTAFTNAIAAAAGKSVVAPAGTWNLESNVTVSAGVTLNPLPTAIINIASTKILTINGVLDAGIYQIFSGAGTVVLAIGSCPYVLPQWWGAVGDNSTDCTDAFDSAMITAQTVGKVFVPSGTYIISAPLDQWPVGTYAAKDSGITIEGVGTETVFKYTATSDYCFKVTNPDPTLNSLPVGNALRNFHIEADSVTSKELGGCIVIDGAADTIVTGITADNVDDATFLHARAREITVSDATMTNDSNHDFTTTGAGAKEKIAVKFTTLTRVTGLKTATVRLGITGAPAGTVHAELWSDSAGPNAQIGDDSTAITINTISNAADGEDVTFEWAEWSDMPAVSASTAYWIVLSTSGYTYTDTTTELRWRYDADGGSSELAAFTFGGAWSVDADDGANYDIRIRYLGQSIGTTILNCNIQGGDGVGRGIWIEDWAFVNITDSYMRADECVRNEQSYFRSTNVYYLGSNTGSERLIYSTGYDSIFGGTLEALAGGDHSYFGGIGTGHSLVGISPTVKGYEWENGTNLSQAGGWFDFYAGTGGAQIPDVHKDRIFGVGETADLWTQGGARAADANALNGYRWELDASAERVELEWGSTGTAGIYGWLPRGLYKITVYAYATDSVTDDFQLWYVYGSAGTISFGSYTLPTTAVYMPYIQYMHITGAEPYVAAGRLRIWVRKGTATPNTIYISHATIEHVGPDIGTEVLSVFSTDNSDADGRRQSDLEFWGQKADRYQAPLVRIRAAHDGAGADFKGKMVIQTNDGTDVESLVAVSKWLSDGTSYHGDGGVTNYLKIAADGFTTLHGTARAALDIEFTASNAFIPAANQPDDVTIGVTPVLQFDKTGDESVHISTELPHTYCNGTDILAHFHWAPADADAGNVTWGIEWHHTQYENNEILTEATTTQIVIDATDSRQDEHLKSGNITIDGTGISDGDELHIRVFRDADASEDGASDTYDDDASLLHFDLEIMVDSFGEDEQW